nr:mitogen-activated protein kinase kinase 5-like [Ipomoea batatas]
MDSSIPTPATSDNSSSAAAIFPTPPPNYPINISELKWTYPDSIAIAVISTVYKAFHPPSGNNYALKIQEPGLGPVQNILTLGVALFKKERNTPWWLWNGVLAWEGNAASIMLCSIRLWGNEKHNNNKILEHMSQILFNHLISGTNSNMEALSAHFTVFRPGEDTDFGTSQILDYKSVERCELCSATAEYMSPERIQDLILKRGLPKAHAYAGDIWSLGLTIWELYVGEYPLGERLRGNLRAVNKAISEWESRSPVMLMPDTTSPELRNFIGGCLEIDPENRLTVRDLLGHPFISRCPLI